MSAPNMIKMSTTKELSVVGIYSSKKDLSHRLPADLTSLHHHRPISITPLAKRPTQGAGKIISRLEQRAPNHYDKMAYTRAPSSGRCRTNSWPTLRHKLWLDITDMPIHELQQDKTINPFSSRPASRNVSKSSSGVRNNHGDSSIHVGVLDQWRMSDSYTHHGVDKHRPGTVRMRWRDINPSTSTLCDRPGTDRSAFRLPSRMGPNTLESFLHHSTLKDTNTQPLSPLDHTDSNSLLNLRTLSRNPVVHINSAVTGGKTKNRFHNQPNGHYWLSDTSPPSSPPSMNSVYHITNYVHTS